MKLRSWKDKPNQTALRLLSSIHLPFNSFNTVEEAISQILIILSSPPLARYFPFGENANAYIPAVIPEKTLTCNEEKLKE